MANDRKLAGVLVESNQRGHVLEFALLGIGINANFHKSVLQELSESSTSLLDVTGSQVDRERLICSLLSETENLYEQLCSRQDLEILTSLRKNDWSRGRPVNIRFDDRTLSGTFKGYESLTTVRISLENDTDTFVETGSVVIVDYPD